MPVTGGPAAPLLPGARRALPTTAGTKANETASVFAAFEARFLSHLVLALDDYFLHRGRTIEGKDGNPLNEVRLLCDSIKDND